MPPHARCKLDLCAEVGVRRRIEFAAELEGSQLISRAMPHKIDLCKITATKHTKRLVLGVKITRRLAQIPSAATCASCTS